MGTTESKQSVQYPQRKPNPTSAVQIQSNSRQKLGYLSDKVAVRPRADDQNSEVDYRLNGPIIALGRSRTPWNDSNSEDSDHEIMEQMKEVAKELDDALQPVPDRRRPSRHSNSITRTASSSQANADTETVKEQTVVSAGDSNLSPGQPNPSNLPNPPSSSNSSERSNPQRPVTSSAVFKERIPEEWELVQLKEIKDFDMEKFKKANQNDRKSPERSIEPAVHNEEKPAEKHPAVVSLGYDAFEDEIISTIEEQYIEGIQTS